MENVVCKRRKIFWWREEEEENLPDTRSSREVLLPLAGLVASAFTTVTQMIPFEDFFLQSSKTGKDTSVQDQRDHLEFQENLPPFPVRGCFHHASGRFRWTVNEPLFAAG